MWYVWKDPVWDQLLWSWIFHAGKILIHDPTYWTNKFYIMLHGYLDTKQAQVLWADERWQAVGNGNTFIRAGPIESCGSINLSFVQIIFHSLLTMILLGPPILGTVLDEVWRGSDLDKRRINRITWFYSSNKCVSFAPTAWHLSLVTRTWACLLSK